MKKQSNYFAIQLILILSLLTMTASTPMNVQPAKSKTSGFIINLDPALKKVTLQTNTNSVLAIIVDARTLIKREKKTSTFDAMRVGDKVEISYDNLNMAALTIDAKVELREVKGMIVGFDPANNSISILPAKSITNTTLTINSATQFKQNGKTTVYSSLILGSTVSAKYIPISLIASSVDAKVELREVKGMIVGFDTANNSISILPAKSTTATILTVNNETQFKQNGKTTVYSSLILGSTVSAKYIPVSLIARSVDAKVELREIKGTIISFDPAHSSVTILPAKSTTSMTLTVNNKTQVKQNGNVAAYSSLVLGSTVSAKYIPISLTASSIDAKIELREIKGTITGLDPINSSLSILSSKSTVSTTLTVNNATQINRNGVSAAFTNLQIGDKVEAKYIFITGLTYTLYAKGSFAVPTATPTITQIPPTVTQTPQPTQIPPTVTPTLIVVTHSFITSYEGPQTCINCHASSSESALHSEHLQWSGKWTQINTYCTAPVQSEYACLNCHAGTGKITNLTAQDVDCLICHSDTYQRTLGPKTSQVTVTDWQGNVRTFWSPEKVNNNYQFQPDFNKMPAGTTMLDVARNITKPTTKTCLRCHAKAGGGDGSKRGDIFSELASPTLAPNVDVHLSPTGAKLTCLSCHKTSDHKIPGKGIDLRVSEGGNVDCTQCHAQTLHLDSKINQHTDRVACQTCHIPKYGKVSGTEMFRDWRIPVWNANGLDGQGAWVGQEVRQFDVIPSYKFWNGQSFVYSAGQALPPETDGSYYEAKALGSINSGKLYPIKIHTAYQPIQNGTNTLVMFDVLWNFLTGRYEEAAQRGLDSMGTGGTYNWALVKTDQLITHGVEPKAASLQCATCHETRTQMNLSTMGYTLKDTQTNVCTQCHENKGNPGFYALHTEHVTGKRIECSMCHSFSRPERGLLTGIITDN